MADHYYSPVLQLTVMETRCRAAVGDKEVLEEQLEESTKDKKGSEKRLSQLQTKLTKSTTQLKEEKEVCQIHVDTYI